VERTFREQKSTLEVRPIYHQSDDKVSSPGESHPQALSGRVGDWRAYGRVRWLIQGFRPGPQSGSPGNVSNPRLVKPGVRFSRTGLSC
jgi:hypothetical protein